MITGFYAGLLGLLYICLFVAVVRKRIQNKISIGTAGDEDFARTARIHGNFAEYIPFVLFLLAFTELQGTVSATIIHGLGVSVVLGRLFHIQGMKSNDHLRYRQIGMMLTIIPILILSIALIVKFVTA